MDDNFQKLLDALEDLGLLVQKFDEQEITCITISARPFERVKVSIGYDVKVEGN